MDFATTLARLRTTAASAGTLLLVSAAFALSQMTSLALGAPTSRQLNLSLSAPSVDLQEEGNPFASNRDALLGELAAISVPPPAVFAAAAGHAIGVARKATVTRAVALVRTATPVPHATSAATATTASATAPEQPTTRPSTDPRVILETETETVAGTNYHDPDVRGLRLARGRRPGSRG